MSIGRVGLLNSLERDPSVKLLLGNGPVELGERFVPFVYLFRAMADRVAKWRMFSTIHERSFRETCRFRRTRDSAM